MSTARVALALAFLGFFEDELFKQVKLVVSGEAHRNRQLLGRMRQSPSQPFTLLPLLLALVLEVACFSTGAPASACKEMEPRHNFMPQNQHHDYQVSDGVLERRFKLRFARFVTSRPQYRVAKRAK
ncbi:hypothetical protein MRX96_017477 [Rhipicephalus microplus]